MKELYEDVLAEEPKDNADKKTIEKWEKRLYNSVGWIMPLETSRFYTDTKGKACGSSIERKIIWSVEEGNHEGCVDFDSEENARIYSELIQLKERMIKIEKLLGK